MLLEFASKGDFFRYFQKVGKLGEQEVANVLYQLLLALKYIHAKDIIHRDIKLENILMEEGRIVKLCDFGWCSPPGDNQRNIIAGTYEYMAPEVVKREKYSTKIDIWSMGVLAFELLHRYTPFKGPNSAAIMKNITSGLYNIDYSVSQDFRDFIKKCLTYSPKDRPTAVELLDHPIFNTIKSIQLCRKSLRYSTAINPAMKATYMPELSYMAASNLFDKTINRNTLDGLRTDFPAQANLQDHESNIKNRFFGNSNGSPRQLSGSPLQENTPSPTKVQSDFVQQQPQVSGLNLNDPWTQRQQGYPPENLEPNQPMRESYEPEFEINLDDKREFRLDTMGDYLELDIKPSDVFNWLAYGGNAVVGFFGDFVNGIENMINDFDKDGRKVTEVHPRDKTNKKRESSYNSPVKSNNQSGFEANFLPEAEANKAIKIYNVENNMDTFNQESQSSQRVRGPVVNSYKNKPIQIDHDPPEISAQEAAPPPPEPSFFDTMLGFFGFSSENEDLKMKVKTLQAQRNEMKRRTQRKLEEDADSLYESHKGPN